MLSLFSFKNFNVFHATENLQRHPVVTRKALHASSGVLKVEFSQSALCWTNYVTTPF